MLCGAVNEGSCHWCLVVGYIHHYFEFMHCFYKWHGGGFIENSNIHVAEFVRFSCKFKKLLKEIFKWNFNIDWLFEILQLTLYNVHVNRTNMAHT